MSILFHTGDKDEILFLQVNWSDFEDFLEVSEAKLWSYSHLASLETALPVGREYGAKFVNGDWQTSLFNLSD